MFTQATFGPRDPFSPTLVVTVQSQLCGALIATLSYNNFEIIQLQRIESATKYNV